MMGIRSLFLKVKQLFIRKPNEYPWNCPYFIEDVEPSEIAQRKLWLEFNYRKPSYDKKDFTDLELDLDWYNRHPWDDPLV